VPESYLGITVPDMPNYAFIIGPTWPIENGSVFGSLAAVANYIITMVKKMQNENLRYWVPRQDISDQFNQHVQEWVKHTVWTSDCRSCEFCTRLVLSIGDIANDSFATTGYKNNETGRVNAIWPGSGQHFCQVLQTPRFEDYEVKSFYKNPWAHLGMGWTVQDRKGVKEADLSPHLNLQILDPKWWEAIGGDPKVLEEQRVAEKRGQVFFNDTSDVFHSA